MSAAPLSKTELFLRLAEAPAGVTVATPNARLAQELQRAFDAHQLARGLSIWDAPDILTLSAFIARAYEDALYSERAEVLPLLLAPTQEQALWEDILGHSDETGRLLALPQAAAAARDAWKTGHEWAILEKARRFPKNEDAEAFLGWAQRYERITTIDLRNRA